MAREDTVREEIKSMKKPATKTYVAVLLVVAAALALYFLFTYDILQLNLGAPAITGTDQAQSAASNVGKSVSDISSEIDAINGILGG